MPRSYTAPMSSKSQRSYGQSNKAFGRGATTSRTAPPNNRGRQNSVQTKYMDMLLGLDTIPRLHTILASFFTYILLAGFLVLPGTFTNLSDLDDSSVISGSKTATTIINRIQHGKLLIIAGVCSGLGALGMLWLWLKWRNNYVWLLNKIFMPGCMNSIAGLLSTLVGVYGQQNGVWSSVALVTIIVTGSIAVAMGLLFAFYNFVVLRRVKQKHGREMASHAPDETIAKKVERAANKPGLEPGSVV